MKLLEMDDYLEREFGIKSEDVHHVILNAKTFGYVWDGNNQVFYKLEVDKEIERMIIDLIDEYDDLGYKLTRELLEKYKTIIKSIAR